MKKIFGFLGAMALCVFAGCSSEDLTGDGPQIPEEGRDLYMTLTVKPVGPVGTRTATPDQGKEVGQDYENTVASALVIFAEKNDDKYTVFTTLNEDGKVAAAGTDYVVTYSMERSILLDAVKNATGKTKTFTMFVIANPTTAIVTKYQEKAKTGGDVQDVFELEGDANTYWKHNNFLMSSADLEGATVTITEEDVDYGTHTTPATALNLGRVNVQRAMSRFDLATDAPHTVFTVEDAASPLGELTLTFDQVALINMTQQANMFKVVANNYESLGDKTIAFGTEAANNWVFSAEKDANTAWIYPLFDGGKGAIQTGAPKNLAALPNYVELSSLTEARDTYTPPTGIGENTPAYFKFWRYCMENTNPDNVENQKNGNSTGIVFRAKMTSENITEGTTALYAYGNVVFGDAVALRNYALGEAEDHDTDAETFTAVSVKYKEAVEMYNAKADESKKFTEESIKAATAEDLAVLDTYLVKEENFTIYRADSEGNFYCYYLYWNRHNDNGQPTIMGTMEFATVRNNVYKIYVSKVMRLGHPAEPGDDPDEPDPEDPDEEDNFYCQIECHILPWEVRLNGVEF